MYEWIPLVVIVLWGKQMLVLSRHRDESIVLGDEISIVVVDIRGDKVRLGIDAPIGLPVHRQEVYDAIKRAGGETPESKIAQAEMFYLAAIRKTCEAEIETWNDLEPEFQERIIREAFGKTSMADKVIDTWAEEVKAVA